MNTDLTMLTYTAAFTALLWIPYILARIVSVGAKAALTYVGDTAPLPAWAARSKKAHYNAIENLAPFAALVIVAQLAHVANATTATAAQVFFWARVAHFFIYTAGIPVVRTLTFAVGWAAMAAIFVQIVQGA